MIGLHIRIGLLLLCWSMFASIALAQASSPFFVWVRDITYESSAREYQVEIVHASDDAMAWQASLTTVPAGVSMMDKTVQVGEPLVFSAAALRDGQVYAVEVYALNKDGKRIQNDANRDVMAIYQFAHRVVPAEPILEDTKNIPVVLEETPTECNLQCQMQAFNVTPANLMIGGLSLVGLSAIALSVVRRRRQLKRRKNVSSLSQIEQESNPHQNQTTQIDMFDWENDSLDMTNVVAENQSTDRSTMLDGEALEEMLPDAAEGDDELETIMDYQEDSEHMASMPYAEIRVIKSPDAKREGGFYQVYEFPYVLGRDKGHLTIFDKRISSTHAKITFTGSHYFLTDLGSSNGIYINGKRMAQDSQIALPMSEETKISLASTTHLSFTGYSRGNYSRG